MIRLLFVPLFCLFSVHLAEGQTTSLQGRVSNKKGPLPGVKVLVIQEDTIVMKTMTDITGTYQLAVDSGNYNVEFSYPECMTLRVEGMELLPAKVNVLNAVLSKSVRLVNVNITSCGPSLIRADETSGGQTFTAAQIRHMY